MRIRKPILSGLIKGLLTLAIASGPVALAQDEDNEIYELSPFSVDPSDNVGYSATSSLAGTRLNTPLRDVASTVSIITKEFLEDTNSTDLQELLVYTTGTEVGGIGGNFANPNANRVVGAVQDTQFKRPASSNRIRGLARADLTRDYFSTIVPMDSYNTDRVVINRGANAILFGLGSPAGIINNNTIKPLFGDHGEVQLQIGSYGSQRASLDVEKVLIEDKLSFRLATLYKDRKYAQDPAHEEDKRIFAVGEYRPFEGTSIRASYELGEVDANRPRTLPPQDMVSRWWDVAANGLSQPPHDAHREYQLFLYDESGERVDNLYFGPIGFTFEAAAVYDSPLQSRPGGALPGGQEAFVPIIHPRWGADTSGGISFQSFVTLRGVEQLYGNMPGEPRDQNGNLKSVTRSFYVNEHITDSSIFDFRNLLIDGPNKNELENFSVFNFSLEQVFFEGKAGLAYHFNKEDYKSEFMSVIADGSRFQAIAVDVNSTFPNGDVNPNFGRLFLSAGSNGRTITLDEVRENHRVTGFAKFDLSEKADGLVGQLLGDHTFTGLLEDSSRNTVNINALNYAWGEDFQTGGTPPNANNATAVGTLVYLSDDISGQSSAAGANASNLKAKLEFQDQYNLTYFDRNTKSHVASGTFSTRRNMPVGASLNKNSIQSSAIILNSRFLNDHIVATYGYREDEVDVWSESDAPRVSSNNGTGNANIRNISPDVFFLPSSPTFNSKSDASNLGLVAHVPDAWMENVPGGTGLSLHWADAENAQIGTERTNLLGEKLGPVSGSTEEKGFTLSFLENRISVRFNWYETLQIQDDSGLTGAFNSPLGLLLRNYAPVARANNIATNIAGHDDIDDLANYESAFANAQWVLDTVNARVSGDGESIERTNPTGLTFPTDLKSEGMEIEGVASITENWRLFFNVAKQEVTAANTAPLYARFLQETVNPLLERYGKFSTSDSQVESLTSWSNRSGLIAAKTAIAADGGIKTNEIRKWRWNIGTNYTFDSDSRMKGWNVGGAARWQDNIGIGRPVIDDPELGFIPDLANPIYGTDELNVDGWIGWGRPLALGGTDGEWHLQLNVRNLLDEDDLIPVVANPDLTIPVVRIPAERTWELRSTYRF
jgi:outer membrane receptor protein involved in Fe transport